ncbi:hypothetical protein GIB67_002628 [Kingdonia uniflora]|uniref:ATP-dependent DNA helicase n=1 Tax=Kingdonia uniflora TaxID=39325 RepID=A0A7J7N4B9_9MAGN|nr:hypothetical protein GIB67_002628 [Kingdonia uniflora]
MGCDGWDEVMATRIQIPLKLAYALSVHKCQGMTIDQLETYLLKAFGYKMGFTALSRVKSLDGLYLIGLDPSKIKAHPKDTNQGKQIASFVITAIQTVGQDIKLNIPEFDGKANADASAYFDHITPSVLKCQGMTIDRLETDLSKVFGYGMVFFALSRVKSLDGLYLIGFDPSKIKANPKVTKFYNTHFLNEKIMR